MPKQKEEPKKFTIEFTEESAQLVIDCLTIAQAGYHQRVQQILLGNYRLQDFTRMEADKFRGRAHEVTLMIRHMLSSRTPIEREQNE